MQRRWWEWAWRSHNWGRPKEAIETHRLALELNPKEADAHNNLGWTLASEGES